MSVWNIAPELGLVLGAVFNLLVCLFIPRHRQYLGSLIALGVIVLSAIMTFQLHLSAWDTLAFSGKWHLDNLKLFANLVILLTAGITALVSSSWFKTDARHGEYYSMLLLSTTGAMLMVGAADLTGLLFGVLLSSVTGYTLASFHRSSKICAEAGAKYYFLGAVATPILFLGIVFVFALAGSTEYSNVLKYFLLEEWNAVVLACGVSLMFVGLAFKLGAFPMHFWVPDVSQGSPAPVAMFLSVVPKIAALVAIYRIAELLPDFGFAWRTCMALIAAITMTVGNLTALWQTDLRRLIGWSSVSQAGYGLMAIVAIHKSEWADSALLVFLLAYAIANICAFVVVISLRGRTNLDDYQALIRKHPLEAVSLILAMLSLTGLPPLIGFTAKLQLFTAVIQADYAWLAVIAVINTVISLFYYLRVVGVLILGISHERVRLLDLPSRLSVATSAALIVILGLVAQLFITSN